MSFKQSGSFLEKHKKKPSLLSCWPHNESDCFVLCVLYRRSNLFETCQMGKEVQHCKIILNSSPDQLGGAQTALGVISNIAFPSGRNKGKIISFTFTGDRVQPESAISPKIIYK